MWGLRVTQLFHPYILISSHHSIPFGRARRSWLDPSSASAEPDDHLVAVDDDRHVALAFAVLQHSLEACRVLLDVDVLERDSPPLIIVTGGLGVGSTVFAENQDHGDSADHVTRGKGLCHCEKCAERRGA